MAKEVDETWDDSQPRKKRKRKDKIERRRSTNRPLRCPWWREETSYI